MSQSIRFRFPSGGYITAFLIVIIMVVSLMPQAIKADGAGNEPIPNMVSTSSDTSETMASEPIPDTDGAEENLIIVLYCLLLPAVI